jgi:hypothetical protein
MTFKTVLLGAIVGVSTLVGMAGSASAYVACNREGDCWHTEQRYSRPGVRFDYHPDDYYFHQRWDDGRRHWREHRDGRGYYRNGIWLNF